MRIFHRAATLFRSRRTWRLHELGDWALAPLGVVAFVIAGYWTMAVVNVLPDLVRATNQHGLSWMGTAAFVFLAGLGVTIWFFGCVAARCHSILLERHFR